MYLCLCAGVGVCVGGDPCSRSEPLVPTRRVSHRTVAKTSPQPRGSEESRPKAPARASALAGPQPERPVGGPPPGSQVTKKYKPVHCPRGRGRSGRGRGRDRVGFLWNSGHRQKNFYPIPGEILLLLFFRSKRAESLGVEGGTR